MKASTISAALATSCGLALAVSSQPAIAWQEVRAPIQIPSDEEISAKQEELAARNPESERDRVRDALLDGLDCERRREDKDEKPARDYDSDTLDEGDVVLKWFGGWKAEYRDEACDLLGKGDFLFMSREDLERLREAEIGPDNHYNTQFLVLKNGIPVPAEIAALYDEDPEDPEDPEGSDEDISDEDRGADGVGIDDLDDDAGGDFGDDPDPRPTTGGGTESDSFDEDPEGSDDDTEPADDSTAGSTIDPDAVIPPQRTGATGLSGQFETSNENGIIFGAVIWWLYGPGGVEVQNYRRNQLLVDLVPGATYRVVAKELGENGRTAELTFTPQGTGFTFTRGLRFQ